MYVLLLVAIGLVIGGVILFLKPFLCESGMKFLICPVRHFNILSIRRHDTRLRRVITVERRVAVNLWCLATSREYRTFSHLFGIGRSTVCDFVQETCKAIVEDLLPQYIRFPSCEQLNTIVDAIR